MTKNIAIILLLTSLLAACIPQEKEQEAQAEAPTELETTLAAEEAEEERAASESAFPPDSVGEDGRSFHGERIDEAGALPLAQLASDLQAEGSLAPVKVRGEVTAACQMKGCWMTMDLSDEQEMRVRFKDYGFFVPKDCAGKTAVVEGRARYDTTSVADLRHYAVDGGMSETEAEQRYTEPEVAVAFEATGVIIE